MKELRKFGDVEVGFVTQFNNTFSNREANLDSIIILVKNFTPQITKNYFFKSKFILRRLW